MEKQKQQQQQEEERTQDTKERKEKGYTVHGYTPTLHHFMIKPGRDTAMRKRRGKQDFRRTKSGTVL